MGNETEENRNLIRTITVEMFIEAAKREATFRYNNFMHNLMEKTFIKKNL